MSTIAAIATPCAPAGLGVVRLSGEDALAVAQKIFRSADGIRLRDLPPYTARYGHVFDADGDIDECVALVFRAPHSYTGEDVAELSCHGGVYLLRRTLQAAIAAGARMAQAGEFTRRSFLNGKMDLSSAEAVADLIGAQGRLAAKSALAARGGALFHALQPVKESLTRLLAQTDALIDYPDDDIPPLPEDEMKTELLAAGRTLDGLLSNARAGMILREGVDTVIAGSPNVGKSTLMNLLAGSERSIVTEMPGTTRDIVEETVQLGDVTLRLSDTAGLRGASDPVERIGVSRAREKLDQALLVLAVFDASRPLSDDDLSLLDLLRGKDAVIVLNKCDLSDAVPAALSGGSAPLVSMSAKTGEGLLRLREAVEEVCGVSRLTGDEALLCHERQIAAAAACRDEIHNALCALGDGWPPDAVASCLEAALSPLLELTGERATEEAVREVFSRFCVGK